MLKLRPLADRIVVKKPNSDEMTPGGLHLPDCSKQKQNFAEIIAVGPGKWDAKINARVPMEFEIGETVLFVKGAGAEVKLDEEEFVVLSERDVLGTMRK